MSPFEELYGRKIIPVRCGNPEDRLDLGLEKLEQMEQVVHKIKQILKTTQDRQKKLCRHQTTKEFRVNIFLRVKPKRSSLGTKTYTKIAPRFVGPFEVVVRVGLVAY